MYALGAHTFEFENVEQRKFRHPSNYMYVDKLKVYIN